MAGLPDHDELAERATALVAGLLGDEAASSGDLPAQLIAANDELARRQASGEAEAGWLVEQMRTCFLFHRLLTTRRPPAPRATLADHLDAAAELLLRGVGFERMMAFTVVGGVLEVAASRFVDRSTWADDVYDRAVASPPELDTAVLEAAVVDGQQSVLVADAQVDPRTWKPVVSPLLTGSYVVAPIVVGGRTVATIHADRFFSSISCDERDRDLIGLVAADVSRVASAPANRGPLTPQQEAIMEQLVHGASNAAIAAALFVSPETVKTHLRHIYARLGVANRTEAVAWYLGQAEASARSGHPGVGRHG